MSPFGDTDAHLTRLATESREIVSGTCTCPTVPTLPSRPVRLLLTPIRTSSTMDNSDPLAPAHTGDVDEGEQAEYTHTFVDEDADVILRSSDNIDFRVYKVILSRSSDFFKGMFTLPQSSNQPRAQPPTTPTPLSPPAISRSLSGGTDTGSISEYIDGVPVVPVAEPSQVLDHVLQFLYPMPDPDMSSLDVFCPVLEAATKYDIEHLVEKLRKIWPTLAENDPLRSFALAYKSKWQEETSIAARMALEKPIWPLEPPLPLEFRCISAEIIIYLESYHRKCGDAAFKLTETREWAVGILEAQTCAHCNKRYKTQNQGLQVLDWMTLFLKYAGPAVKVVPSAKTVRNPELLHQSIVNSYQTTRCEIPMHCEDRFKCFVEILANEIDEIVSRVSVTLCLYFRSPCRQESIFLGGLALTINVPDHISFFYSSLSTCLGRCPHTTTPCASGFLRNPVRAL